MFETWLNITLGVLWGFWLALYLDRLYSKQVTGITLCVFVLLGKSFKANRALASAINIVLISLFLLSASAVIGQFVASWFLFIVAWCVGMAVYSFFFSLPKKLPRRKA